MKASLRLKHILSLLCILSVLNIGCQSEASTKNNSGRDSAEGKAKNSHRSNSNLKPNPKMISYTGEFPEDVNIITFVCDRGGLKSKIAATYFNSLAEEKGINYRATARTMNLTASSPKIIQKNILYKYRKHGLNIKNPAIVGFRMNDASDRAEQIIFLDDFTYYGNNDKFRDWTDLIASSVPSFDQLAGIEQRVKQLMTEI